MQADSKSAHGSPEVQRPVAVNLLASLLALALVISSVAGGEALAARYDTKFLPTLAVRTDAEKLKGDTLNRQAVRDPEALVLFGSSEAGSWSQFASDQVFNRARPTGFYTYHIAGGYRQSLHNALALAALGGDLRDKKVVVFISPSWFSATMPPKAHLMNYSSMQTYETIYGLSVSNVLKRRLAQRLLELGAPATDDHLLRGTLGALKENTIGGDFKYWLLWPFGRLELAYDHLKDTWDSLRLIRTQNLKPATAVRQPKAIDWSALMAQAGTQGLTHSTNNRFGMDNDIFANEIAPNVDKSKDASKRSSFAVSTEYQDLQLVLDTLHELGAQPLFISLPVMGTWYDYAGWPRADRQQYYSRVRDMVRTAGFPIADLTGHEDEFGFMRDPWHPGWKGWVYIDEVLDGFYHGQSPSGLD